MCATNPNPAASSNVNAPGSGTAATDELRLWLKFESKMFKSAPLTVPSQSKSPKAQLMPVWLKFESTMFRSAPLTVPFKFGVAVDGVNDSYFMVGRIVGPAQAVDVAGGGTLDFPRLQKALDGRGDIRAGRVIEHEFPALNVGPGPAEHRQLGRRAKFQCSGLHSGHAGVGVLSGEKQGAGSDLDERPRAREYSVVDGRLIVLAHRKRHRRAAVVGQREIVTTSVVIHAVGVL